MELEPLVYDKVTYGLLWIAVEETPHLRQLHTQLNRELSEHFGDTQAEYDGDAYRFHITVMMGGQPFEVYQEFLATLPDLRLNRTFVTRELAVFVYDDVVGPGGEYLMYKRLPLG